MGARPEVNRGTATEKSLAWRIFCSCVVMNTFEHIKLTTGTRNAELAKPVMAAPMVNIYKPTEFCYKTKTNQKHTEFVSIRKNSTETPNRKSTKRKNNNKRKNASIKTLPQKLPQNCIITHAVLSRKRGGLSIDLNAARVGREQLGLDGLSPQRENVDLAQGDQYENNSQ